MKISRAHRPAGRGARENVGAITRTGLGARAPGGRGIPAKKNGSTTRRKPPNAEICIRRHFGSPGGSLFSATPSSFMRVSPMRMRTFPSPRLPSRDVPWRDVPVSRVRNSCSLAVPLSEFLLVFSFGAASGFTRVFVAGTFPCAPATSLAVPECHPERRGSGRYSTVG